MNEYLILESATLRKQLCTEEHAAVLDKVGQLVYLPNTSWATIEGVAQFYEVPVDTIQKLVQRNREELRADGYKILSNKELLKWTTCPLLEIPRRGLAIFPRRAVLRAGMLLRDSRVAKMIRTYLLNAEQLNSPATHQTLRDMARQLTQQATQISEHAGQLTEHANQLSDQAVQLQKNADQLISQSHLVAAIINQLYESKEQIKKMDARVSAHDKAINAHNQHMATCL